MIPNRLLSTLLLGSSLALAAHASTDSFIITVKTDNAGTSADTEFTMPIDSSLTYDYIIDCDSDGTPDATNVSAEYTCSYDSAGTYTISIDGTFPRIYFAISGDSRKLLSVEQWGSTAWTSMASAFMGCINVIVNAQDTPNLSSATSLAGMFASAYKLGTGTGNWNWNVSTITNMNAVFNETSFNKDIGSWDVSNVTTMSGMFMYSVFNQDISRWDISNVTDMSSMFQHNSYFNQDIGNWNVSNTRTDFILTEATSFNQDLGDWNFAGIDLTYLLSNNPFSISNYDALLEGLAATATLEGRTFDAGDNTYCEASAARQSLIDDLGWTIIDGGQNCEYYIDSPRHVSVESGTTEVLTVSRAWEPLASPVDEFFTIVGGADKDLFEIDLFTGTLTFKSAPDFNNPQDNNKDNVYRVQVEANNDYAWRDQQTFSIEVTDSGSSVTPNVTPLIMYLLN